MKKGLLLLWVSSFGMAFILGYQLKSITLERNTQAGANIENLPSQNVFDIKSSRSEMSRSTSLTSVQPQANNLNQKSATSSPLGPKEIFVRIKSLLADNNMSMDMSSIAQSYLLVKDFTEQELLDTLALLQADLDQPNNLMPVLLILERYAELNAENAIAFIEDNISSPQVKMAASASVISTWSKQDPLAAYDWYNRTQENNSRGGLYDSNSAGLLAIFNSLASRDLDDALEKLADISTDRTSMYMAVTGITGALVNKEDFINVIEKSSQFDDNNIKETIIASWVMKNPQETVDWLDSIDEPQEQERLREDVLANWIMSNPQDAVSWYMSKADESNKQTYADNIVYNWGSYDPDTTLNWLDQQSGIDQGKSTKALLESSVFTNPNFAIDHLKLLNNDKDKADISLSIYMALEHENKQKAAEFLTLSPYREQLEDEIKKYQQEQQGPFDDSNGD